MLRVSDTQSSLWRAMLVCNYLAYQMLWFVSIYEWLQCNRSERLENSASCHLSLDQDENNDFPFLSILIIKKILSCTIVLSMSCFYVPNSKASFSSLFLITTLMLLLLYNHLQWQPKVVNLNELSRNQQSSQNMADENGVLKRIGMRMLIVVICLTCYHHGWAY